MNILMYMFICVFVYVCMPGAGGTVFQKSCSLLHHMGSGNQTQIMGLHSDLLSLLPAPTSLCVSPLAF